MSGQFDFTGDYPRWEDADENLYEKHRSAHTYNLIVSRLMYLRGFDQEEAERKALQILEDDGA